MRRYPSASTPSRSSTLTQQVEERRIDERLEHRGACRVATARVPDGA
jgi:hypothetical protein